MLKHLIIGADPAGLATAVALQEADIPFEIVDAGDKPGGIWEINRTETPMYKSAHFISSRTLSGFEDFPMPEDFPDYPSHALVQAYIEQYADKHQLNQHARFQTRVVRLEPDGAHWIAQKSSRKTGPDPSGGYTQFLRKKKEESIDLQGKNKYINSLRHQRYVDKKSYRKLLKRQINALNA